MKHVGRVKSTKRKVIVAYRVVPGEPDYAIVVPTENLMAEEHDALIKAVESDAGQSAYEFGEAMARNRLPDGRNMLAGFHATGRMTKVKTSEIEMIPDSNTSISLDELNEAIATNKGVTVADLAIQDKPRNDAAGQPAKPKEDLIVEEFDLDAPQEVVQAAQAAQDQVLTDEELAAKYRSDADRMFKEAKRLREQAEELVPTKKKSKTAESA